MKAATAYAITVALAALTVAIAILCCMKRENFQGEQEVLDAYLLPASG